MEKYVMAHACVFREEMQVETKGTQLLYVMYYITNIFHRKIPVTQVNNCQIH